MALVKYLDRHLAHIVFIEGLWIVATTVAEDGCLGGRYIPVGRVEVEFEYGIRISFFVNYSGAVTAEP
jgi:hypothetical protein